jgi:phosphopantothenoylcysteine synthetase/decarboxylase
LIYANISGDLPYYLDAAVYTPDVESMHKEVLKRARKMDWIVKCAAVSVLQTQAQARHKIKKGEALQLELVRTQDILADLGKAKLRDRN